jgi:hypothetical protein
MPMTAPLFQARAQNVYNKYSPLFSGSALSSIFSGLASAVTADAANNHDLTVTAPGGTLSPSSWPDQPTRELELLINRGRNDLGATAMGSILTAIASGGAPPFTLPGTPTAAYSMRRIVSGYAGKAIKVRRSSDNASQDIGFAANGWLDMAAASAFAAGSTLWIDTWYDQGAGGLNAKAATTSAQPQLNVIGGVPYIAFGANQNVMLLAAASVGALALTGDQTIGIVCQCGSDVGQVPVACSDGSSGWALFFNGVGTSAPGPNPAHVVYWGSGGSVIDPTLMFPSLSQPFRYISTRASGAVKTYTNGAQTGSGTATNNASPTPLSIGSLAATLQFSGLIGEIFIYSSALTPANISTIDANQNTAFPALGFHTPYSGTACLQFGNSEQLSFGNVLQYERTQAWTMWAAVQLYFSPPLSSATCIMTNVPVTGTGYPGYELWIGEEGTLRVRLISNIGTPNYLDVRGSTNVCDGKKHMVVATYDGSSTPAGVKFYIDGVLDTSVTVAQPLTATIVASGQAFIVGSQQGMGGLYLNGALSYFQLDNIVRSAAVIAPVKNGAIPPKDANTAMCLPLNEGSGAAVHDTSTSAFTGTLTSSSNWLTP